MIGSKIDVVDSQNKKISQVRASANGKAVENKMRALGLSNCSYQLGSYQSADGTNRNCWKPVKKSLATLISITHNL